MGAPLLWKRVTTAHRIVMAMTAARVAVATVWVDVFMANPLKLNRLDARHCSA
jgi:hypothetical protein